MTKNVQTGSASPKGGATSSVQKVASPGKLPGGGPSTLRKFVQAQPKNLRGA
jgi:hypothetical protein